MKAERNRENLFPKISEMPLSYAKIVQAGSNAKFIWICPGPCSPGKTVLRGECRNSASDYRLSPYMATHFPGRAPRENPQYAGLSAVGKSASFATGSSLIKPNKKMTGIFFGSTTGTTESVAARIAERLGVAQADVHNVAAASVEDVKKYDLLLLGSSTWGSGELQDDWPGFLDKLGKEDLSGRRVALFGCGDAGIYSDTFCDAMAEIRDGLASTGCTFVGGFDAEEYPGCGSRLCQDGEAIGWAVDDSASDAENQMRMELWIAADTTI